MPTCVVQGCTNSSKKKFKMNSLPRNPIQRALWIKNINQPNWIPKQNSVVCEVHFAPEMWEKTRVDGTQKLKCNAVPTIFDNQIEKKIQNKHIMISPEINKNNANVRVSLSENNLNLQQVPIVISSVSTSSSLNLNSKILPNNLRSIGISKPKIKMKSLKPLILENANSFTNRKIINGEQTQITICRNSDLSEMEPIDSCHNLTINNVNKVENAQVETNSNEPVLKPVDQVINLNARMAISNVSDTDVNKSGNLPVLIPTMVNTFNNINSVKPQVSSVTRSLPTISRNSCDMIKTTNDCPQSLSIPVTEDSSYLKTQIIDLNNHEKIISTISNSTASIIEDSRTTQPSSLKCGNKEKLNGFVSTGIILNKVEAKKIEDERFEKMDKLLLKQLKLNDALRKKLIILRRRLQRLTRSQDEKEEFESSLFLRKVFTDDQIKVLQSRYSNLKSVTAWTDDTMLKAIKLKKACGLRGYKEILSQNLPYPSIKTITRWCTSRHIEIP